MHISELDSTLRGVFKMLKNTEVTDEDKHPIETQLEHDLIAPCEIGRAHV